MRLNVNLNVLCYFYNLSKDFILHKISRKEELKKTWKKNVQHRNVQQLLMMEALTHFRSVFPFYTLWKQHQKTRSSLIFSKGIKKENWPGISKYFFHPTSEYPVTQYQNFKSTFETISDHQFIFIPYENVRKPKVLWCIQGV